MKSRRSASSKRMAAHTREWRRLARTISVGGTMPLTFSVQRERHGQMGLTLIATATIVSVCNPDDETQISFTATIPDRLAAEPRWLLGMARWAYLHELDEHWTTSGGRTRNPHLCDGIVRWPLSMRVWRLMASFCVTSQEKT